MHRVAGLAGFVAGAIALLAACSTTTNNITEVLGARESDGGTLEASTSADSGDVGVPEDASDDAPLDAGGGGDATPPPTATVTGSVSGHTITGPSAVALFQPPGATPTYPPYPTPAGVFVTITDVPATCAMIAGGPPAGHSVISLGANVYDDAGFPPGSFPITGSSTASGASFGAFSFSERTEFCGYDQFAPPDGLWARESGTVTVSSFDGGSVQGNFTVVVDDAGAMSGTFDTTICPMPLATYDAGCQ